MKTTIRVWFASIGLFASLAMLSGCTEQEATDSLKRAEATAEQAATAVAEDVGEAMEKGEEAAGAAVDKGTEIAGDVFDQGKELASALSEKASAYLTPIKQEFGSLEGLKEKPDQLKAAVTALIESIEAKAEDIELPESVSSALATVKEKLIALKDYLEGEFEQAKIDEHLKEITDSAKHAFGM